MGNFGSRGPDFLFEISYPTTFEEIKNNIRLLFYLLSRECIIRKVARPGGILWTVTYAYWFTTWNVRKLFPWPRYLAESLTRAGAMRGLPPSPGQWRQAEIVTDRWYLGWWMHTSVSILLQPACLFHPHNWLILSHLGVPCLPTGL